MNITLCLLAAATLAAGAPKPVVGVSSGPAAPPVLAPETAAEAAPDSVPSSQEPFPKRQPSHTTWEKIAAFPGKLLYLPFWLTFQITGGLIVINEEYDAIPRTIDFLTSDDRRRGIFPTYSARGGFGVELFAKDYFNEDFRSNLTATWGFRGRKFYQLRARRYDLFGGFMTGGLRLQYRNLPDDRFYGIGTSTQETDETNYQHLWPLFDITLGKRFTKKFQTDLILGVEHNEIKTGRRESSPTTNEVYDESTLPGVEKPATLARVGLEILWDRRNRTFRPSKGFVLSAVGGAVYEPRDEDFGYSIAAAALQFYQHLFYDRILVLRGAFYLTDPFANRAVPFYKLATLGQTETIRGYQRGRYRDNDMVLATIEYRYPVWRIMDGLFFADFGQVSPDIWREFSSDIIWSVGGGFGIWSLEKAVMRLELGYGEEGFRVHFIFN